MAATTALTFVKPDGSLVPIERVKEAIGTLCSPKDVGDFARQAEAAKRACAETDERRDYFAELSIWATVRLGELLATMDKRSGRPKKAFHAETLLSDIGVNRPQSHRSQKLAAAQKVLPAYIAECKSKGKEITKGGALAVAKRHLREQSLAKRGHDNLPPAIKLTDKQDVVSCHAVITDPPYGITSEPWEPGNLEKFTRHWLSRWDESGANWIISFFSQEHLWAMRVWMDQELRGYEFHHLAIWHYPNGMGHKSGQVLKESWEPIFIYRRKDFTAKPGEWDWQETGNLDCIREGAPRPNLDGSAAQVHPCQKPVRVMKLLVNAFSAKGQLIVDPFAGSGTTGVAAAQLERSFHGIETNADYRKLAKSRILSFGESE